MKKCKYISFLILLMGFLVCGCEKLVEVDAPVTSVNQSLVYSNDAQAVAVLTGIYTNMSVADLDYSSGTTSASLICGLSADELIPINANDESRNAYYKNNLNSQTANVWANIYNKIYVVNAALEGLANSNGVTMAVKNQLIGESKFIRAFNYFYLVNFYGDIPLAISTDYKVNSSLKRSNVNEVYTQIINDLKDAVILLNDNYLDATLRNSTLERVRPNKAAAMALLARVYLYTEDYVNAELEATNVINQSDKYNLVNLNDIFLKNNNEAIWQLMSTGTPINLNANSKEGALFVPISNITDVYLSSSLVNAFERGDQRKAMWIGMFAGLPYPQKYKIGRTNSPSIEYSTILRLGEMFLIRAEARIQKNDILNGISDLNRLRIRATDLDAPDADQLPQIPLDLSKENALRAVVNERRIELFAEWGHRWLDLKRLNLADNVLQSEKGANWKSTDKLYPIPKTEMDLNPSLMGHQNPGYDN